MNEVKTGLSLQLPYYLISILLPLSDCVLTFAGFCLRHANNTLMRVPSFARKLYNKTFPEVFLSKKIKLGITLLQVASRQISNTNLGSFPSSYALHYRARQWCVSLCYILLYIGLSTPVRAGAFWSPALRTSESWLSAVNWCDSVERRRFLSLLCGDGLVMLVRP